MKNSRDKIRDLYFVFIPKINLKVEPNESRESFVERLISELEKLEINILKIDYDLAKVINFLTETKHCIECQEFDKSPNGLCYFCEFKKFCKTDGKDTSELLLKEEN